MRKRDRQIANSLAAEPRHSREHVWAVLCPLFEHRVQPLRGELRAHSAQLWRQPAFVAHLGHVRLKKGVAGLFDAANLVAVMARITVETDHGAMNDFLSR